MAISKLEQLLHDRWMHWEGIVLSLQRQKYALPKSEENRLLRRANIAEEDYRKVAGL